MKYLRNVALALVAFVFVACGSQSPSEVAKEFTQKTYDDKIQVAYEEVKNYYSAEMQKYITEKKVKTKLDMDKQDTKDKGGIKEIIIESEKQINDTNVYVVLNIFYNNGEKERKHYSMVKESGKYLLNEG